MTKKDDYGQDGVLFDDGLPFFLDHDLQMVDTGTLMLVSTLEVGDLEKVSVTKPVWEITQFIMDNVEGDYQELYAIAAELEYEADKLRDLAQTIEDSDHAVSDLFNVADE